MKVKYVESVIISLPNFRGSIPTQGGLGSKLFIQWFKTDDDTEFIGLNDDEALDLLNFINSNLTKNLSESVIKELEEENLPYIPLEYSRTAIKEYELLKVIDYTMVLDFEVKGYLPIEY